jgi:hypothetical protein
MKLVRCAAVLAALSGLSSACLAAGPAPPSTSLQGETGPSGAAAPPGRPKICLDVQSRDDLTRDFADRLRDAVSASGALSLAVASEPCSLTLHVPGNLLRFETAGSVMVSTVVIVTSSSGHYLSTSIAACRAGDLKPCAARAVAAAKLALLLNPNGGT